MRIAIDAHVLADDVLNEFGVGDVAELVLLLAVVAGDAHDVAGVVTHEVGVLDDQRLAHARGVLLVNPEDDGLLEAVAAFS